jgi:hypothetical protein
VLAEALRLLRNLCEHWDGYRDVPISLGGVVSLNWVGKVENVQRGIAFGHTGARLVSLIRAARKVPVERDALYREIRVYGRVRGSHP